MQTRPKIQRRWLLPERLRHHFDTLRAKPFRIQDGFLGTNLELRVRVIDQVTSQEAAECSLMHTWGIGRTRLSGVPVGIETAAAYVMLASTKFRTEKYRRLLPFGWKADEYFGPLDKFLVAEIDLEYASELFTFPDWLSEAIATGEAIEVTDWLTARHLAWLAADLSHGQTLSLDAALVRPKRIAFTGSPCSGKTSMLRILQQEVGHQAHFLPEIATIVISQAKAMPPVHDALQMRNFQHGIYRIQCGFEDVSTLQVVNDKKLALFTDRGTVDNAAYLHGGTTEFCDLTGLSLEEQYARYDGVLALAMAPREVYEREKSNNAARSETYEQAGELDRRIREVWRGHPNYHFVAGDTWEEKVECARRALREIVPGLYST